MGILFGEFGVVDGGELGAEELDCCVCDGGGEDLVRRYSIQVKCSLRAMVCFWRKIQQGQLLT